MKIGQLMSINARNRNLIFAIMYRFQEIPANRYVRTNRQKIVRRANP